MDTTREVGAVHYERDPDLTDLCAETGAEIFTVADRLSVATDRGASAWTAEELRDLVLARDILRAAEAAVILLLGGGDCAVSRRMAARSRNPGMDYLRRELRAHRPPPQGALLGAWGEMIHDA
jgi:hypothetical protein